MAPPNLALYLDDDTTLLEHGSFMDYKGGCEQFLHCRLCGNKWLWENDEPSDHKDSCPLTRRDD